MRSDPIAAILAAQSPEGWWVKPGPGYAPKYTGTVWSLIFLDQLGADAGRRARPAGVRVRPARTRPAPAASAAPARTWRSPPPPSSVLHCLNGNLLRALIGFGHLERSPGPVGDRLGGPRDHRAGRPALLRLGHDRARVRVRRERGPAVRLGRGQGDAGAGADPRAGAVPGGRGGDRRRRQFLLSRDPATADYPMGWGNTSRPRRGSSSASPPATWPTCCRSSRPWPSSATRAMHGWRVVRLAAEPAGRGRSVGEPLRVPRQDLGGRRTPGRALQVGHPARVHGAAGPRG